MKKTGFIIFKYNKNVNLKIKIKIYMFLSYCLDFKKNERKCKEKTIKRKVKNLFTTSNAFYLL